VLKLHIITCHFPYPSINPKYPEYQLCFPVLSVLIKCQYVGRGEKSILNACFMNDHKNVVNEFTQNIENTKIK